MQVIGSQVVKTGFSKIITGVKNFLTSLSVLFDDNKLCVSYSQIVWNESWILHVIYPGALGVPQQQIHRLINSDVKTNLKFSISQ